MQKKIVFILILMSSCVLSITGLQLYWNYQNYKTTVENFRKDSNNALDIAVNKEIAVRQRKLVLKMRHWLADTSLINITCNYHNRDSNTVFIVNDVHPRYLEDTARKVKIFQIGIAKFGKKLKKITPEAKNIFIDHFSEGVFKRDIENGTIYYYTQGLGDSISKAFDESKLNKVSFAEIFKKELAIKEIHTPFKINQLVHNDDFITKKQNSAFRRPYDQELVWASLENPNHYYWRAMKSLIISSLLLIGITIFCFYYTIKTLFGQHKLVAIKNQFISNMTHEIHTPLSSIQITAEALKKFDLSQDQQDKYLDIILFQTNKLNELSKEILDHAKLETSTYSMEEKIELNQLILFVINDLKFEEHILVKYRPNEENIIVTGNKKHLSRSISNLLENAVKYNGAENPTVELKLSKGEKAVTLTIEDNGPGIADEYKQKIFDQFYRIPTGNVHNIKGYGLGLSYVKKTIAQHHGSINVFDNQPKGSIFSINLRY